MIGAMGIFNPFLIIGGVLSTVATGLLMTLEPDSSSPMWIGYQALAGIGLGLCFTVPIIVLQARTEPMEIATASAITLCESFSFRSP